MTAPKKQEVFDTVDSAYAELAARLVTHVDEIYSSLASFTQDVWLLRVERATNPNARGSVWLSFDTLEPNEDTISAIMEGVSAQTGYARGNLVFSVHYKKGATLAPPADLEGK